MSRPDFSRRSEEPELMDQPCDYATFAGCLRDLATVNRVTLAHGPTLRFLERLRREARLRRRAPIEILDVGSGYGDLLRAIDRWAARKGVNVRLTGLDLSPWSARAAREAPQTSAPTRWVTANVFDWEQGADVIVSSLFTHHLQQEELVRFVRWMEGASRIAWYVNDLHRHPLPYYGFKTLARAMRWHPLVQHDGPVSIARAFTPEDWRACIGEAGLSAREPQIRQRFPFRLCVERVRP